MERQELPFDSGEEYAYLPAEREDKTIETGRPKYLPIDSCQAYGIGCNNKTDYLKTSRQKRSYSPQKALRMIRNRSITHQEVS